MRSTITMAAAIVMLAGGAWGAAESPTGKIDRNSDKILKLAEGQIQNPRSIHATPDNHLLVLDQGKSNPRRVQCFDLDGSRTFERAIPLEIEKVDDAWMDSSGTLFVSADRSHSGATVWRLSKAIGGEAELFTENADRMAIKKTTEGEFIFVLKKDKIERTPVDNLSAKPTVITLSRIPAKGWPGPLRIRADGHIYVYASTAEIAWTMGEERRVYHFDAAGKLVGKFGHSKSIYTPLPGAFVGDKFDVDDNGDIYWSLGDYGAMLRYTADGKNAFKFVGSEAWNKHWTGRIGFLAGFAISGGRGYVVDGEKNRITSFPKTLLESGSQDCVSVDVAAFGMEYKIESDVPYKLFTGAHASLRALFPPEDRISRIAELVWTLLDFQKNTISEGKIPVELPESGSASFDINLSLPKLGWYELDTAVVAEGRTLIEKISFLSRVVDHPNMPIPAEESTGWDDTATHQMLGLGLLRVDYHSNPKAFDKTIQTIADAKAVGIPFMLQITDKKDCTPEVVKDVLTRIPDLPALEIMNEPNMQNVSPAEYVKILQSCYAAAKAINPKVQVLGPTQCGVSLSLMKAFLDMGGGKYVDAISIHPYDQSNSVDAYHLQWWIKTLREMLDANGYSTGKEIWQTEHGFLFDDKTVCLKPAWQARMILTGRAVFDRFNVLAERYFYYYLNEGGYGGFRSFIVDGRREILPAGILLRVRASMLKSRTFSRSVDFGSPGDWLLLGNVYAGKEEDVLMLMNCGAFKPVDVRLSLPAGSKAFDAFGNEETLPAGETLFGVGRYPTYFTLPHGASFKAELPVFGKNIAPDARMDVDDRMGTLTKTMLTNGRLEFNFQHSPDRGGFYTLNDHLPLDLTFTFDSPRDLSSLIVYGSLAEKDRCTPTAYDILVRRDGKWERIDEVVVKPDGRTTILEPQIAGITLYDNPWIFVHRFEPVKTDAVRLHFTDTTSGGEWAKTESLHTSIRGSKIPAPPKRVMLREVQIFTSEASFMKNAEPVDTALAAAKDADERDIVIVKAEYGDAGGNYDVTELVRSHVKGGSPTFKVGADMFGWPGQWGRVMRTTLNYKGKRLFLVNAEGDMFDASVEALEKAHAYSTGADAIRIVKAEYGGGIKWTDVSAKIAELLKSGTFKFTPSRMLLAPDLGQPLGGEDHKVLKLTVHYKARTTLFIAEELTEVNLSLEAIDKACDKTERCRGIEIIQADFGAGDWRVDVTAAVSEWFKDGASGFKISSPLFGDPAPRLSKVFRIKYKLNGNSYEKEIREGGILELP